MLFKKSLTIYLIVICLLNSVVQIVTNGRSSVNVTVSFSLKYICSVLGDEVVGIWPKNADKADVNCAHLSNTSSALATGDDDGLVKLFKFPSREKYVSNRHPSCCCCLLLLAVGFSSVRCC